MIKAVALTANRTISDWQICDHGAGSRKINNQHLKWCVMNQFSYRSKKGMFSMTMLTNKNESAKIVAAAGFMLKHENMKATDIITLASVSYTHLTLPTILRV